MNIFVDTGAWIALADKNDQYHATAFKIYQQIQKNKIYLVITDYVFDETVTWLTYRIGHGVACRWGNAILQSSVIRIIHIQQVQLKAAWCCFEKFHDAKFSFTDCISFEIMKQHGISHVFGFDSHFSMMGFTMISDESITLPYFHPLSPEMPSKA